MIVVIMAVSALYAEKLAQSKDVDPDTYQKCYDFVQKYNNGEFKNIHAGDINRLYSIIEK